jgi:hypothetical protein
MIDDLAKSVLMDASQRDDALAHATSCERCQMRLTDERVLTAGFRKLATVWTAEPSAEVESALLDAFRSQRAEFAGAVSSLRKTRRWIYAAAGVAALVIIVLMLSMTISRTPGSREPGKDESATASPPAAVQQEPSSKPNPSAVPEQRLVSSRPTGIRAASVKQNRAKQGRPPARDESTPDAEIATEFFPLNRGGIGQLDSAQVVRVKLPRSAMMSFGLPIDMDRADERIKADVVVGNDGLAKAIRFVR